MANTTIKISQLPNASGNLTTNILIPVVTNSGTLVTDKVTLGNVANYILEEAGNTLPEAFVSQIAYSVANASQPNITSVGNLNINTLHITGGENGQYLQTNGMGGLSWVSGGGSGNGSVGGANGQLQFNSAGNFAGDPELTWDAGNNQLNTVNFAASHATIYGNLDVVNVNATGNLLPNAIYTDHYYYANGYVFGGGGGNGTPGGSNTQVQFNDNGAFGGNTGFTFNKTTGIFTSPFLAGNGNGLSNIQGANISGAVGLATYAGTANSVAGANVSGAVSYAGTANSVAVGNVVGIGNIATVALNGNGSQVLLGNGTWGNAGAGSSISNGISNVNIPTSGGAVEVTAGTQHWAFGTDGTLTAPGAINVGNMVIGTVAGDITADNNTTVAFNVTGSDGGFLVNYLKEVGNANTSGGELAFSSETGNATYRISLSDDLGDGFATKIWRFDGSGLLTLPGANVTIGSVLGGDAILANNTPFGVLSQGNSGATVVQWNDDISNTALVSAIYVNGPFGNVGDIQVRTGDVSNANVWTFSNDGNLVLANGNSVIRSVANSSLDPLIPNVSTMILTPDANYNSQVLVLDPTAPGHIHLRAPSGTGNIDEPAANIFLGGEASSFEVGYYTGSAPNVFIHSGSNTWTFSNDGNLTIPGLTGTYIKSAPGGYMGLAAIDDGGDQPAQLVSINSNSNTGTTAISAYANQATIQTNITGSIKTWAFDNVGILTFPVIDYANLSAATTPGKRAFINDANLAASGNFGATVSGGGSNTVPVYSDGSNWCIG